MKLLIWLANLRNFRFRQTLAFAIVIVIAALCVFWTRYVDRYVVVPGPSARHEAKPSFYPTDSPHYADDTIGPRELDIARVWMTAGRPRAALHVFKQAWESDQQAQWSRGRLALYICLCYQQIGEFRPAKTWFQVAIEKSLPEFPDDGQDLLASIYLDDVNAQKSSRFRFVSLSQNSATASENEAQHIQQAVAQLRTAQSQFNGSKLETRVRYASWLLMVAEITSKWDDLCLTTTSIQAFAAGKKLLAVIATELDANPALQKELDQTPALAIRFDAAQARLNVLNEREAASLERERARLNQLRSIAKSYRAALESLGTAEANFLSGNLEKMSASQVSALEALQNVEAITKARKELYLFSDEPNLTGDADFNILKIAPLPYSSNLISFHKALRAFSLLQSADEHAVGYEKTLEEAHKWATASLQLDESLPDALRAFDEKNILALYVQSTTSDSLALVSAKSTDAAKRAGAQDKFSRARLELKQLLKFAGDIQNGQLRSLIDNLISRLSSADTTLRLASTLIDSGHGVDARKELLNGALRHHSDELAVAYFQLGRRLGISIDQDQAQIGPLRVVGLLAPTSAVAVLEASRITLAKVGSKLAVGGVPVPPSPEAESLRQDLKNQEKILRDVLKGEAKQQLRAQLTSQLALTLAYSLACDGKSKSDGPLVQEVVHLAQDASALLEPLLKDGTVTSNLKESYRECLIDARMALGYAGLSGLPNYHDESMLAFMSALDVAVQGRTTSTSVGLLGSPLLRTITARSGIGDAKLAAEERMRRQLMTRFVEGAFTLQFGQSKAAARQFSDALSASNKSGAAQGTIQAEGALHDSDAFDAETVLFDSTRSFEILSEVRAGLPNDALLNALRLVEKTPVDSGRLVEVVDHLSQTKYSDIRQLQSPLSAVAVALAAEAYAVSIPLDQVDQALMRTKVLELALQANNQAAQLLESPRMSQRYNQLTSLTDGLRQRLQSPDFYIASISKNVSTGKVTEAAELCDQGLRRHPDATGLWREFVRLESIRVIQNNLSDADLRILLGSIERAAQNRHVSEYDRAYIEGLVHEKLHDSVNALASYEAAIARATNSKDRVRALANASSLRARQPYAKP